MAIKYQRASTRHERLAEPPVLSRPPGFRMSQRSRLTFIYFGLLVLAVAALILHRLGDRLAYVGQPVERGVAVVVAKFLGAITTSGWAAIVVTMLALGSVQLFTLGIIGLYVARIYNEAKGRPRCIVESTIGFENDRERPRS